jgi:hypothetical protein
MCRERRVTLNIDDSAMAANGPVLAQIGMPMTLNLKATSYCHVAVAEGCRHVVIVGVVYRRIGLACVVTLPRRANPKPERLSKRRRDALTQNPNPTNQEHRSQVLPLARPG